jgi:hypothetical protein
MTMTVEHLLVVPTPYIHKQVNRRVRVQEWVEVEEEVPNKKKKKKKKKSKANVPVDGVTGSPAAGAGTEAGSVSQPVAA